MRPHHLLVSRHHRDNGLSFRIAVAMEGDDVRVVPSALGEIGVEPFRTLSALTVGVMTCAAGLMDLMIR